MVAFRKKVLSLVAPALFLCAVAWGAGGCFGSEESDTASSGDEETKQEKTAKQPVKKGKAGSKGSTSPEPDRPPGWQITVSGSVEAEASGQSVMRKYASNSATAEQIVLAGTPFEDTKGNGRVTFTLAGLAESGAGTYTAKRAVATLEEPGVTCELSTDADDQTELTVDVERDANVFEGSFEGTLKCDPPEDGEEPRFVDIEGSFLDF